MRQGLTHAFISDSEDKRIFPEDHRFIRHSSVTRNETRLTQFLSITPENATVEAILIGFDFVQDEQIEFTIAVEVSC
jgi:hypothetical protein